MPAMRFWALYGAISQIEAQEDLRALSVTYYGAQPWQSNRPINDFTASLQRKTLGKRSAQAGAYGMPTSALHGPMVSAVERNVLDGRIERARLQVEEQKQAWQQGGWAALVPVLAAQQKINQGSP